MGLLSIGPSCRAAVSSRRVDCFQSLVRSAKRDWLSDLLPLVTGKKHRFLIFTRAEQKKINEARKMTTLPDLSALLGSRLGGPSSNEPILVSSEATREETLTASPQSAVVPDLVVSDLSEGSLAPEVVEPEKTKKKGKKRAASGISVSSVEGTSAEAQSNEPSKKKTKEKKRKKFVEEQTEPDEVAEGREIVVHDGSGRGAAARAEGGSNDSPGAPLERKKRKKQSVDHDVPVLTERDDSHASEERGEAGVRRPTPPRVAAPTIGRSDAGRPRDMPPVSDLFFKDAYVNAARTKKYDTALKDTLAQLGKAEKLAQVRGEALTRKSSEFKKTIDLAVVERDQLLAGKKAHKERFPERFGELKDKFRSSHERVKELEREKALGSKVITSPGGTQVGEGVLEISDSSSEDRSERDPVEKTMGPELDDAEKSPGARSEPVETVEATPVDEQTEGISVDPPNSSADVPDGSVPPVV
ncbi:hypothetical protein F2Q68_00016241 [Brassica cretica]|uniref:Uncharacterized protein n=1 Tax=Brassica cretica TaxID=69181 RepID=A0A8S9HL93_BRACR|nr:hypothetical protein F2Q68_00016241 [Brassica cretica]